ncbi:MAG: head-tail connector protein [Leuconostoc mesenteroides]
MITASDILDELHIDSTDTEIKTINRIIANASSLVRVSIKKDITDAEILAINEPLYTRLIITIVAYMYYNRTLDSDIPLGAKVLLDNLRWEVLDHEEQ